MTDEHVDDAREGTEPDVTAADAVTEADTPDETVQYGVGPFTIRELAILVGWLAAFVVSFFPLAAGTALERTGLDFLGASVWTNGLAWVLTIGVPTVAVFLLVLRRFSPQGIRRVGSLGIDQFASVAMSVAAVVWLQSLWETIAIVISGGPWIRGWVVWVELALMIALVVLTVFAPLIPPLNEDFQHRPAAAAHRNARPVRRVVPTPRPERPAQETVVYEQESEQAAPAAFGPGAYASGPYETGAYDTGAYAAEQVVVDEYAATTTTGGDRVDVQEVEVDAYESDTYESDTYEPGAAVTDGYAPQRAAAADSYAPPQAAPVAAQRTPDPEPVRVVQQAFWALAPVERDVLDERGVPIFRVGPTAWALVIEDRGEVFVVRHDDGRIGYLHDVSDITRG